MKRYYALLKEKHGNLKAYLRHFPYTEFLFFLIPLYAMIVAIPKAYPNYLQVIPFIFGYAFVFIYNDICDKNDSRDRNPARDEGQHSLAKKLTFGFLFASLITFALTFRSPVAYTTFILYVLLGFAYSGLGLRLKETLIAPIVACLVGWVGAPLIVALEYDLFTESSIALLVGTFLFGVSREIAHTVMDYEADKISGYKTFAVMLGINPSILIKYLFLVASFAAFTKVTVIFPLAMVSFSLLLIASLILEYGVDVYQPAILDDFVRSPYVVMKYYVIFITCLILGLNLFENILVLWIYSTAKRG
ncbi:MAG: UbiA family prenyltransferase [Candidatus Altiarchaeota archaeon]